MEVQAAAASRSVEAPRRSARPAKTAQENPRDEDRGRAERSGRRSAEDAERPDRLRRETPPPRRSTAPQELALTADNQRNVDRARARINALTLDISA